MRFPLLSKSGMSLVMTLAGVLIAVVAWIEIMQIHTITVTAEPSIVTPGGSSIIRVHVLNRLGFATPFQHRTASFELEQGEESATLETSADPLVVKVTALRSGDVQIRVTIEGEILPYLIVIHAEHLMADYRSVSSNAVDASVRTSRYFTMIGDETDSP